MEINEKFVNFSSLIPYRKIDILNNYSGWFKCRNSFTFIFRPNIKKLFKKSIFFLFIVIFSNLHCHIFCAMSWITQLKICSRNVENVVPTKLWGETHLSVSNWKILKKKYCWNRKTDNCRKYSFKFCNKNEY